jgi:uncharacterized membrane protein
MFNMTILFILRILIALFFIYAGYSHFKKAWFFYKITPPYLQQWKEEINTIVGVAEIAGGLGLLIPQTQSWAAWGIIALLVAVFPANIYMLTSGGSGMKIKMWFLWLRIPLQFALIALMYQFT